MAYLVDEAATSLLVLPVLDDLLLGDVGPEGDRLATDADLRAEHESCEIKSSGGGNKVT